MQSTLSQSTHVARDRLHRQHAVRIVSLPFGLYGYYLVVVALVVSGQLRAGAG